MLAWALFEHRGYWRVWAKMVVGLRVLALVTPSASFRAGARRRVGPKPFRALFTAVAGPVGRPATPGAFWHGLRSVAIDATCLHVANSWQVLGRYARRTGQRIVFGYPLLRLTVLVECGTRAIIGVVFGPEADGETTHARRLLDAISRGTLVYGKLKVRILGA
ncbi:MAG: hypothetical protein HKP61_05625 [Dactylosporangium sp.]|nr:transposase domain-containing protein [Dactylosporangium sp.]NNJ60426.1 hypothetical protein [Dactylosporangium sp.]